MLFITIMAWIFLILSLIRIVAVFADIAKNHEEIKLLQTHGYDPVGGVLTKPFVVFVCCLVWIITTFIN